MKLPGERIKIWKWIHAGPVAVRVQVEAVIPPDGSGEACLESDTVRLLDEVQRLANAGDVGALSRYGEVYVRRSA
jgi:hypothetical protein